MPRRKSAFDRFHARLLQRGFFRMKPGLERVQTILATLGSPHQRLRTIHIAGTNGKGSVAAMLESVLRHAGYKTGLYTSPHLKTVRERIRVGGAFISERTFAALGRRIIAAEKRCRTRLTYFEFTTVMAFLAFQKAKVDLAVVEVGLGGALDATNVLIRPEVSVVTSIGLDHTAWLGRTEREIASQKAGIIKAGSPVVSGVQGPGRTVISRFARTVGAPLYQWNRDFRAAAAAGPLRRGLRTLEVRGAGYHWRGPLALRGKHQIANGALVIQTLELLRRSGWKLGTRPVAVGMASTRWPGRLDLYTPSRGPAVLFDGAHNAPAASALAETLSGEEFRSVSKTLVFSAFKDKDIRSILAPLRRHCQKIVLTRMAGSRAASRKLLVAACGNVKRVPNTWVVPPEKALKDAKRLTPSKGLVVVTGSLTLVGQLLPPSAWRVHG